ncbi:MAG: hypothetical protein NTY07_02770 [Bacteroidia bacterium]|nr:hypothetical protein [Bacteroidia bacterium]
MKTKLILLVVLIVLAASVNAQTKAAAKDTKGFTIGAGAMVGLPMGDVTDFYSLAYGVDLLGEISVAPSFAITISAGYVDFAKKSGVTGNAGMIPVLGGFKLYLSDKLYGSVQAGLSFGTASGSSSAFTFAPAIGYKLGEKFDLSLKYQSATKNSWNTAFLGLRAGLTF